MQQNRLDGFRVAIILSDDFDQEMVRDRNWVTSRSPRDLGAFNPAMVSLFAESKTKSPQR